ncbi:MAG: hypothetical protein PHP54_03470 [Clostridia bacterium]|nr:hypothetical protein [Clostridia bacterium]
MDNAQKAIMIGVGLFITIIIIAAVMLITGMGQDMLTQGQNQVSNISSSLQAQLTADFDEATVTGAQVITAIKRYYKDETMALIVNNGKGVSSYGKINPNNYTSGNDFTGYGAVQSTTANTPEGVGKLSDASNAKTYVPTTAQFEAHLIKINNSDNVIGIYFKKK